MNTRSLVNSVINLGIVKAISVSLLLFLFVETALAQECLLPSSSCLTTGHGTGCDDSSCQATICGIDPFCCNVEWDGICVNEANQFCNVGISPDTECPFASSYFSESCSTDFVDISGSGTTAPIASSTDDGGDVVPLGMPFAFFDDTKANVGISSNGYLTFGSDLSDFSNDTIPSSINPNDLIAPLWDDWNPAVSGDVYYQADGFSFVAQWNLLPHFASGGSATFQAELFTGTNDIEFRYDGFSLFTPTVGVENANGTVGLSIDPATIAQDDCIRIAPVIRPELDIKPGSNPNCVNTNSGGVMPVTILGSADFDVADVDQSSLSFGGTSVVRCAFEDVDLDGFVDLSCKFKKNEMTYPDLSTEASCGSNCAQMILTGTQSNGWHIAAVDWVCEAGGTYCEAGTETAMCLVD